MDIPDRCIAESLAEVGLELWEGSFLWCSDSFGRENVIKGMAFPSRKYMCPHKGDFVYDFRSCTDCCPESQVPFDP